MMVSKHRAGLALPSAALVACVFILAACAPAAPSQTLVAAESEQMPAPDAPLPLSFIVNFSPSHGLGQAQSMRSAGRYDEAEQLVGVTLRDNAALRGLCFERFTLDGAEIVLKVCAPSPWDEPLAAQQRWLEQLGATPGVIYAERNLVVQREDGAEAGPS